MNVKTCAEDCLGCHVTVARPRARRLVSVYTKASGATPRRPDRGNRGSVPPLTWPEATTAPGLV
eukprot:682841-Heterocapsa_arctica.AAC.1